MEVKFVEKSLSVSIHQPTLKTKKNKNAFKQMIKTQGSVYCKCNSCKKLSISKNNWVFKNQLGFL